MNRFAVFAATALVAIASQAAGQPESKAMPDWITVTNQPCKVWNPSPEPNEAVTWSGACKDGYATGKGILFWTVDGKPDAEYDGDYVKGKRNGHGVLIIPDGQRVEGVWVDDMLLSGDGPPI